MTEPNMTEPNMTKQRARAAEMFETLAAVHLRALFAESESSTDLHNLLRSDFLDFAQLQRTKLRTLLLLQERCEAASVHPETGGNSIESLIELEQSNIATAIAVLDKVVRALALTGHTPVVIKTLDHWPDIGSDLDLFTSAPERDVVAVMQSELKAEPQPQSWGDQLAHKWNFRIPGLPQLVEIHIGCLGQTGEHHALPAHLEATSLMRNFGRFRFPVPAPEVQLALATLQRMYRHFYIRVTDLVNLSRLSRSGSLDFSRLQTATERWSIWPGVATLLKIASDYNERAGIGPLPLPEFVVRLARFGADVTYVGEQFLRVPMVPHGSGLFLRQLFATGSAREFRAAARLSLLPALAAAAFVNLRVTGDDKGIW